MCFGGSPEVDTSVQDQLLEEAKKARLEEEARQGRIKAGTAKLDTQFAGFNDGFYNTRKNAFLDYYQPQVDKSYKTAKDQLTYALARAGTLNSTVAGDKSAELQGRYQDEVGSILSQANTDVSSFKDRVAGEKSNLTAQLNATGDADATSNAALARTSQMFNELPEYNTLGDIFGGFASGIGTFMQSDRDRQVYDAYFKGGRNGSSRIIT